MANISRRHMLAGLGTAGFASSLSTMTGLGLNNAWAANTSGYKAMVCIFLKGGMDGADTVLPYDTASYNQLRNVREGLFNSYDSTSSTSSRNRANLLKMNLENAGQFEGREFALPQQLSPLHDMFENGDLAVVGNVGPQSNPPRVREWTIIPRSCRSVCSLTMTNSRPGCLLVWKARAGAGAVASWTELSPQPRTRIAFSQRFQRAEMTCSWRVKT